MSYTLPKYTKALTLQESTVPRKPRYYAVLTKRPISPPKPGEVAVKLGAVGFNHKDIWLRMGQYPGVTIGAVFGSDGAGTVVASGSPNDPLLNKRVFLMPCRGWEKDPYAPESRFGIFGGGSFPPHGTFTEYIVVERDQVFLTPEHLDDVHIAAWPLGGLTAWRAVTVNAKVQHGQNILITGIGGGVAIIAMQICLAIGANVYVTSGDPDKIRRAISLHQ